MFFIDRIIVDVPNKPVSKGRSGCDIFRFNVEKPRNPERMKIIKDCILEIFSVYIKRKEIQIKMNAISFSIVRYINGTEKIKKGVINIRIKTADKEPIVVR